jgi:L,D-peptidoglycan transpeptidase YkuD (ErfK/YbiS/YcfS/YnhG family)
MLAALLAIGVLAQSRTTLYAQSLRAPIAAHPAQPSEFQMILIVTGNQLSFAGKTYRCVIGKSGFSADKKEGDGATPLGVFALRECWYRADRLSAPASGLPLHVVEKDDGWCDDPQSPHYNIHVKLPFRGSHEMLWREDHAYDLIVPLGYNDEPVIPGRGSAIFLHLAQPDWRPTEGCVALAKSDLLELLPQLHTETRIEIRP